MAKASKTAKLSATVENLFDKDAALIARDFATFGKWTANNDARTALLRRVSDAETFKVVRRIAMVAWLADRGVNNDRATLICTAHKEGGLLNSKAFGKGDKRTADEDALYNRANAAWNYYLECNAIVQLTRKSAKRTRKPQMPGEKAAPPAADAPKAPPAALSAVVPVKGDLTVTLEQVANAAALVSRVVNVNAKALQGNKGSALRALAVHFAAEIKRIEAMKD